MSHISKRAFRFIYSGVNDGFTNMAIDEAVMMGLKGNSSSPVLRIYKWNPPTISIGYFQSAEDISFTKCREDGIGVVRRLTGGRAVLHSDELTYSILFTGEDFKPFRKKEIFLFIAQCLMDSLQVLGIESRVAEKTKGDLRSANCFASPAQYEIESLKEGKLIGSAQVIKNGVILQHGAIPLSGSYTDISKYLKCESTVGKDISSINQVSDGTIGEESLLEALLLGFKLHIPLMEGTLTEFETTQTIRLAREKYSRDSWMFRR